MTVREIQGHLAELYGTEVSPDLISRVTDAVLDEVREWQNRPLDPVYPVVFFDALRVKIRDEGLVKKGPSMWRWRSIRTARKTYAGLAADLPRKRIPFSSVSSATTSFSAPASRRSSFTSSDVAARAVSPARRFFPASRKSFDQR
jgi:hypothetical protein